MKITRIHLIKDTHRKKIEDVHTLIKEMEVDAKAAGYSVTDVEATLDMQTSKVHVQLTAEYRGELDRVTAKQLWATQDRHKPVDLMLPDEGEGCNQPLYLEG